MKLKGKRFVILVDTQFNDHEFWYPFYRLKEEGVEVVVVGTKSGQTYVGKFGTEFKAHKAPGEINVSDFEGIIIPGGYAPDHMRRDQNMVSLVRAFDQHEKIVTAICHAGWMLVSAGILKEGPSHPFLPSRMISSTQGQNGRIMRLWWTRT